jgi:hypothetical protein
MERFWRKASLVAIGVYLFYTLIHYFMQRPLWNDEYCVFRSLGELKSGEFFTRGLITGQVFPRVYLWLIKQISDPFQHSLLSVRALPFLFMIAGFSVWIAVARRELKSAKHLFFFIATWSASTFLVYYSAELKQYSGDVFAASLLTLFLYRQKELEARWPKSKYCALLAALPLLGVFSFPVAFFLVFPFWNLCKRVREDRRQWVPLLCYAASAVVVALFLYFFDFRLKSSQYVSDWAQYFISYRTPKEFLDTFSTGMNALIGRWFAEEPRWVRVPCRLLMILALYRMFAGWRAGWRRDEGRFSSASTIALVIFLELFILGSIRAYFFVIPQTVLFFFPILVLLMLNLFKDIEAKTPWAGRLMLGIYGVFLLVMILAIGHETLSGYVSTDLTGSLPKF